MQAPTKRLGRAAPLNPEWERMKITVMLTALRAKFAQPELAERLRATGTEVLVEGNTWHDQFWG